MGLNIQVWLLIGQSLLQPCLNSKHHLSFMIDAFYTINFGYLMAKSNSYFDVTIIKLIMTSNNKCDLPKVRIKFKTDPSQIINRSIEIPRVTKYDAIPSIFLERVKMSKEMHEAYMRYRILKKNNYMKKIVNAKNSISLTECKKMETINPKNKNITFHNKLEIALESTSNKREHENESEYIRKSKIGSIRAKNKQSKEELLKNDELFGFKPQTVALKPKKIIGHNLSHHSSTVNADDCVLQMEGFCCQYEGEEERRERLTKLLRKSKKQLKVTRGSSSFLIEAWKQDKIFAGASYYLKNQFDIHQF